MSEKAYEGKYYFIDALGGGWYMLDNDGELIVKQI